MIGEIKRVLQLPELRSKIMFTLLMLVVCRIGVYIPVPGINGEVALAYFQSTMGGAQSLFQMVNIFSGGAFAKMTVFALTVLPYISASIMLQLFVALLPGLQREMQENPELGKRKINKYTRYLTVFLALMQSSIYARFAIQMNASTPGIVEPELLAMTLFGVPWVFYMVVSATMTTGVLLLMWIGEQITEKGIGNGISLVIALGILSQLPSAMGLIIQQLNLTSQEPGQMSLATVALLMGVFVLVIVATIQVIQGHRRIPIQHARRIVGRKEIQGGASYLPLKVNYAGVIPVIFASSVLMFPATIMQFLGPETWLGQLASYISLGTMSYLVIFCSLIIFFTYFWTATQFKPDQIASDMKKNGAFIPGIRQGRPTQEYLEATMNRITLVGAVFLALIAVLPNIIGSLLNIPQTISYFFGGTALLILVGVVLDTMKQVESHLLMKRYDGFMKKGRVRGR
jgi:preprotein translocase subunit SecY